MTAATTTECRIMIRGDGTTTSSGVRLQPSSLPLALSGIVTEKDFDDFLTTVNASIKALDALVVRRKKIGLFRERIFWVTISIVLGLLQLHSVQSYVTELSALFAPMREIRGFLPMGAAYALLIVSEYIFLRHLIKTVKDEKFQEIQQNMSSAGTDLSQRVTTSGSPVGQFSCSVEGDIHEDNIGTYKDLKYIQFKWTEMEVV